MSGHGSLITDKSCRSRRSLARECAGNEDAVRAAPYEGWDRPDLHDIDRPLAPRGERDAERIAAHIERERIAPDLVCCSPSVRTRAVLDAILPSLGGPDLRFDDVLYGASVAELRAIVRGLTDDIASVMIIGHNPGLGDFVGVYGGESFDFPTGALATLELDAWAADRRTGAGLGGSEGFALERQQFLVEAADLSLAIHEVHLEDPVRDPTGRVERADRQRVALHQQPLRARRKVLVRVLADEVAAVHVAELPVRALRSGERSPQTIPRR